VVTLCDIIETSIKKGKSLAEKRLAVKLAAILMIGSLNCSEGTSDIVFSNLQSVLITVAEDPTAKFCIREQACCSIGIICYYGADEYDDVEKALNVLYGIFSKALPKVNILIHVR